MLIAFIAFILFVVSIIYAFQPVQRRSIPDEDKEKTPLGTPLIATNWLQKINLAISQFSFLPVLIRVYLLGMAEVVTTFVWKRGLFGAPSHTDTERAVEQLCQSSRSRQRYNAIITGADSGIGFEIARGLLTSGFHVIIASRTTTLGEQAQRKLKELTGSEHVTFYTLDLCSFEDVHRFTSHVKSTFGPGEIDVLINNAGVMNIPCEITKNGLETQCQTNCLAPLLLTLLLLPQMNREHGHILFAASSTLYAETRLDPRMAKTKYSWNGLDHYAHSKMCVTQLTKLLGEKLTKQASRIKVNCYHPGTVRTSLFAHTTVFTLWITRYFFDYIMLTPKEGSGTALYLIMKHLDNNSLPDENGLYWADAIPHHIPRTTVQVSSAPSKSAVNIDKLWTTSLALCNISPVQAEEWIRSTVKVKADL